MRQGEGFMYHSNVWSHQGSSLSVKLHYVLWLWHVAHKPYPLGSEFLLMTIVQSQFQFKKLSHYNAPSLVHVDLIYAFI